MIGANGFFQIVSGKNDNGEHIFSVVVKRSFRIRPGDRVLRCAQDDELLKVDAYYDDGDPDWATIQYESELAPYKPDVDVVVIGRVYVPGRAPATETTATVRIADRTKSIAVFGDRACRYRPNLPPLFSDPKPFKEMEIRYERAYGGRDEKSYPDIPFFYPRNDMGTGVVLRNRKDIVDGVVLPNFEDPRDLLTPERLVLRGPEDWPPQPLPQSFGWFQRTWYPRSTFAGSLPPYMDVDTVTAEETLGLVCKNHVALAKQFRLPSFHPRFNNGASHGMLFPALRGDEPITLEGLTPDGLLEFTLPGEAPEMTLDLGSGPQQLQPKLDTVSIRPDDLHLDLIWRGTCVYEGYSWLPKMTRLHAEVQ